MTDPATTFAKAREQLQFRSYYETLGVDTVDDLVIKTEVQRKFTKLNNSHINRFTNNVQVMKYALSTSRTNMITTCFKVTFDSTSCIYAYLHSRCVTKGKTTTIEHQFICTGPTFRSQDGEYRNRFIRFDLFTQLFTKYESVFSQIEEMVVEKLSSGKMEFYVDFYYPQSCRVEPEHMNEFVNNTRLAVKLYMVAWLRDFHFIHTKIPENHMNPAYQYIIYRPEDLSTYNAIRKTIEDEEKFGQLIKRIEQFYMNVNDSEVNVERLSCGQKIFPLTVIESLRTDDINYSVWREMYMTNLVSNLVLNLVTPSFPFLGSWFYIQNSHAGLFDNAAMFEKYKHSDIAGDVSTQLRAIDNYNYYSRERQNGALSGKFLQLSKNINRAVLYADSDIRLTDLSVCVTSEYVGRTLRDIPNIIAQKKHLKGLDLIFTNADFFAKHMFEYVYAFYCMNTRLGIIHGDLHMNNVTIFRLYTLVDPDSRELIRNPVIMYIVEPPNEYVGGGAKKSASTQTSSNSAQSTQPPPTQPSPTQPLPTQPSPTQPLPTQLHATTSFVFPHNGIFSMIIDLSRAVLGDVRRLESEFGALYAEAYFRDQQNRLLHIINNNFPEIIENSRAAVTRLVMENFPLMFKILSCIDVFTVASNIKSMFSIDDIFTHGKIKLAAGINRRLESLITLSSQLFTKNINAAIRGDITTPDQIEWPCLTILHEIFSDFARAKLDPAENLTEVFRSGSEMKHDISDYDSWGPLVSLEPYWKMWREIYGEEHEEVKSLTKFLKDHTEAQETHKLLLPYMKQEADVLEFEPWMMM